MENNNIINLKELWSKQATPVPDQKELFRKITLEKKSRLKKILFINITLLLTCLFIILIWLNIQPRYFTTKTGIVLTILAMAIMVIATNRTIPVYKKLSYSQSNQQYLNLLIEIKAREKFIQTTIINLYFILLTAGILLYMYEYTSKMNWIAAIICYIIFIGWIIFNWFYIRPKQIRKNSSKIEALIQMSEKIKKDMNGV